MEYVYRVPDDYDDYMVGRAPIAGDPRQMGRVIHSELERRQAEELRTLMAAALGENDGEMPVGDLLDTVKNAKGAEAMGKALTLLFAMAESHEVTIAEQADSQRIVVSI